MLPSVTPWRASVVVFTGAALGSDSRLLLSAIDDQRRERRWVPPMQPGRPGAGCSGMRHKLLNADPPITYAVVLESGDEVIAALGKFVRREEIEAASMTGIGA